MGPAEMSSWLAGGSIHADTAGYLVKASALLLLTWGLSLVLRRASASTRHGIWTAALVAVLVLPLLSVALPIWRLELLPAKSVVPQRSMVGLAASEAPAALRSTPDLKLGIRASEPIAPAPSEVTEIGSKRFNALFLVWALGAAVFGLRVLVSALSAWWLTRRATPVTDKAVRAAVASVRSELGLRAKVTVVESARVTMPMAWGVFRRIVLLPVAARGWSEARRRVVLLHEVAHLKRRDCETLMLARVVAALHWFNPLVWVAVRKIQAEREHACDDLVLTAGTPGTDYAHHLLDIARGMRSSFTHGWAMVAMARPSELEGRLLAILDPDLNRGSKTKGAHAASVLSIALLAVPLAALQPSTESETNTPAGRSKDSPHETSTVARDPAARATQSPDPDPPQSATSQAVARSDEPRAVRSSTGSQRDARLVEAFANALQENDPESRARAAHALGMMGDSSAIPMLGRVLRDDRAERVRAQAAWALGMIEEDAAVPALRTALSDSSSAVRQQVAWALGMIESDAAVAELVATLTDRDAGVRNRAAWALGMIESESAVAGLVAALTDRDAGVRNRAAWALGMIESPTAVASLNAAVEGDSSSAVRERAAWALGMIGAEPALDSLLEAMTDESETVRQRALWAVGQIAGS